MSLGRKVSMDHDPIDAIPNPTSNAVERTRRSRERRRRGGVLVQFEVVGTALDRLIALGSLSANDRGDQRAITPL